MSEAFDLGRIGGQKALEGLVDEVQAAGEHARTLFSPGGHIERKADLSPVTEADRAIEQRLRRYIGDKFPECGFVGEETGEGSTKGELCFVVDPIDGTRAFIRGLETWSVLVGLEARGVPVLGIAFMPAAEHLFVGVCGTGTTCNGQPVQLSRVSELSEALVCHGSLAQFREDDCMSVLDALAEQTYTQRGLSDFDGYRRVLLGQADAMVDPALQPWDMSAPAALVTAAGGRFSAWDGSSSTRSGAALASNGRIHDQLLGLLAAST